MNRLFEVGSPCIVPEILSEKLMEPASNNMTKLSDFIGAERERFANEDNNKFAMSFSQIYRYSAFLDIILKRYEEVSSKFFENTKATQAAVLPGTHPMTGQLMTLHEEGIRLNIMLHLEIESYYLFAKIMLDKIVHALEFYFGQGRNISLDSHDNLVKYFEAYAEQKGLVLSPEFRAMAKILKTDISDYRDYEIAHEKSPRRMSGTMFDSEGNMKMTAMSLYPTEKDQQVESKVLHDLARDLDIYITQVIELIRTNGAKTRLKTE
jgi:hypothetical protein